jgi:hypothetical protein
MLLSGLITCGALYVAILPHDALESCSTSR